MCFNSEEAQYGACINVMCLDRCLLLNAKIYHTERRSAGVHNVRIVSLRTDKS